MLWFKDRLWRKTRTPYDECDGVDANRNWNFHWMEAGADNFSCSNFYGGPNAFSEVETSSMSEFITSVADDLVGYISFHSYSQYFLTPYSHIPDHLENVNQLVRYNNLIYEILNQVFYLLDNNWRISS